ncbi:MAG: glycosyltransferase family 39 protein [Anaerolineae bacterium]|nr:glycosyltransferase family 39 protein [Anaerolineae bacterium]MDW8070960.1 glycosyltransferase family 39 protein [Anaerolineae bacterium]
MSPRLTSRIALLCAIVLANGVILAGAHEVLRLLAGMALLFVLPGLAWLWGLNWLGSQDGVERLVLLGGLSCALASTALLAAVYWPQPLDLIQVLVALDAITLGGLVFATLRRDATPAKWHWPRGATLASLLAILIVAVYLRWSTLGYAEFHEDELENMVLAVRAMKGEEYAPFLDSKGPVHWLIPAAVWLTLGWINEGLARAPFALCSTLTVLAVFALGRRMAGAGVGLVGAALVAVNGLLVAYARHVENPSIIVLWAVLTAWCAWRFYERRDTPDRNVDIWLVVGWGLLGIGLVAHPNMILYVLSFVGMIGLILWQHRSLWRRVRVAMLIGVGLFLMLAAAFYVPFVLDPYFPRAVEYYSTERIGTALLYNRAADLLELEGEYSSRFYPPWVVLFSAVALFGTLRRVGRFGAWLAIVTGVGIVTTLLRPALWEWGALNMALLPYALLIGAIALSNRVAFAIRSLTLWFGVPYLALAFLARDAATHIRNVHPFWMLLAGWGFLAVWTWLRGRWGQVTRWALVVLFGICAGAILFYEHLQYLGTVADYWRAEADVRYADVSLYRLVYGKLPRPRKLVSNPRLSGWKVVGVLYARGELRGDFRTIKESFAVPIWYTFQTPRSCFEDPQNYFVAMGARGLPVEIDRLPAQGYRLTRIVLVDNQPRLFMWERNAPASVAPVVYQLDDYRALYDRLATPTRYTQESQGEHPVYIIWGERLLLRGYDISTTHLRPGEHLELALYWQALAPMHARYRAFVHVESERIWGQHDDDPVCRLRTDEWRPQQAGVGQFRVSLDPNTPPGRYPVLVGIYDPETGARLEARDGQGRPLGSAFELTTIVVE